MNKDSQIEEKISEILYAEHEDSELEFHGERVKELSTLLNTEIKLAQIKLFNRIWDSIPPEQEEWDIDLVKTASAVFKELNKIREELVTKKQDLDKETE